MIIFPDLSGLVVGTYTISEYSDFNSVISTVRELIVTRGNYDTTALDKYDEFTNTVKTESEYIGGSYNTISVRATIPVSNPSQYNFQIILSNNTTIDVTRVIAVSDGSTNIGQFINRTNMSFTQGWSSSYTKRANVGDVSYYGGGYWGNFIACSNLNAQPEDSDPYGGGGTSDGGGGTGDFDDTSDTVSEPSLPTISGLNTGMFTAFVCTNSDMQSISNYLWGNLITDILDPSTQMKDKIDALKLVVANPYDAIMGCSIVPVSPSIAGSKEVKMYGLIETGISLNYAGSRWVRVDCGTLNINEYWGAYLDYSPYTKTTSLYLPYIGTVSIDIDLIMGKALQIIYHVDILSGICIAYILINGSVEFQYQGQCSTQVPITNSDYSGTIQSALGLVGNVSNIVAGAVGGASGGIAGSVMGATASAVSQTPSIAGNVMGLKPDIKSGGSVGSSGGILGVQKPYLIIERPRQSLPKNQNSYTGYPCNRQMKVSDCVGYTEFEDIKLENIPLTDGEKEELKRILSEGVILV